MSYSHPTLVFVPLMLNLLFGKQIQGFDLNLCVSFNQLIRELEKKGWILILSALKKLQSASLHWCDKFCWIKWLMRPRGD